MADPNIRLSHPWLCIFLICAFFVAGCRKPDLNTQYGKIAGRAGSDSVNGTSVFAEMFEESGFTVKRRQKISPRIDRFGTIVWFPNDYSCPSPEAVAALNEWLAGNAGRTLIYVGRDYDSRGDYLTEVMHDAPVEQKEELLRQKAEGTYIQVRRSEISGEFSFGQEVFFPESDLNECEWFEKIRVKRRKTSSLSGSLATGLVPGKAQIELSTLLSPGNDDDLGSSETLLEADGNSFVTKLTIGASELKNSLIVVSNGSFLLNYALVNREHRRLASNLIDQCESAGGVLFLESGPRGIEVSDSDTTNHNNWAWIAQPPLRYIVPHFLLWCVLYCFVYFPIFGRPKRIKKRNTSTFRTHVNAMGKLLERSDHPDRAIDKIRDYQNLVGGESKRTKQD